MQHLHWHLSQLPERQPFEIEIKFQKPNYVQWHTKITLMEIQLFSEKQGRTAPFCQCLLLEKEKRMNGNNWGITIQQLAKKSTPSLFWLPLKYVMQVWPLISNTDTFLTCSYSTLALLSISRISVHPLILLTLLLSWNSSWDLWASSCTTLW